jgi:hypothetical protein
MKVTKNMKLLAVFIVLLSLCLRAHAFSDKTHKALTDSATLGSATGAYLKNSVGIKQGLAWKVTLDQSILPVGERIPTDQFEERISGELPSNPCSILDFLKAGAHLEDVPMPRARHHFHAPIANPDVTPPNPNAGLDNKTDHPKLAGDIDKWTRRLYNLGFDATGASAQRRALGSEEPDWEQEYENYFAWPDSKTYFGEALTRSDPNVRDHYLALTFVSLGHAVHLLEDMGVPAHTRNDWLFGHYRNALDNGNPFENWVEDQVEANVGQCPWSGTGPVVFDKLAKYFDADEYASDYLGDGQTPPEGIWGLAECSNYQFLSLSTVFGCTGVKYQFPHPAKEHTSSLTEGMKVYFNGANYGVTHLARDSYTHYVVVSNPHWGASVTPEVDSTNTTDDEKVFADYADITMPRTIDYATGLINYFFRGRLDVRRGSADPNIVTELVIANSSDNSGIPQVLKGGTFEIYRDDATETRVQIPPGEITFIPAWTEASILPNDDGATELIAQFAPPAEEARNYVVVYRGQISELPADPDPDDPSAIAVGILRGGYEVFAWTDDPATGDKYGQVSDAPDGADFVDIAAGNRHCLALKSDGSLAAWGYNNYGECDVPDGTDYSAIAAGTNHSIALKSDGSLIVWGRDNLGQITDKPSATDFVAITAGANHSLALKSDGTIVGWGGYNSYGECDAPAPDAGTVYTAIAAGSYHSLALQSDGTVKAWGSNAMGQTRIYDGAAGEVYVAIAACFNYNLLLRDDGMLISWGNDDWADPDTPRYHCRQPDGTEFVTITAGSDHILALTSDGAILAWDWPNGDFPFDYFSATVPEGIVFTDDIAAGYKFSLGLKAP